MNWKMIGDVNESWFEDDDDHDKTNSELPGKLRLSKDELDSQETNAPDGLKKSKPGSSSRNKVRLLWAATVGVATVHLRKPVLPPLSEYKNILTRRQRAHEPVLGYNARGVDRYWNEQADDQSVSSMSSTTGAEARVLRKVELCKDTESGRALLDIGVGASLAFQPMRLQPLARIRIGGLITIKGLPEPTIKVSQSLPFRVVGLQAHLRYEVPIPALMESMDALYKPPARMLLRFEHESNSGIHFYPGGFEFADCTIPLGSSDATLRVAAGYSMPREVPYLPESRGKLEIRRLGLSTLW